ncbi:hypothetical protein JCM8097_005317 [Rhodosporidiobolus ruineniae]
MSALVSSLVQSFWQTAPDPSAAPRTVPSPPRRPHLDTLFLAYNTRTALLLRPNTLQDALVAARRAFGLDTAVDVRLEPGSTFTVSVGSGTRASPCASEEQGVLAEEKKKKGEGDVEQRQPAPVEESSRSGETTPTPADVKGKGKAIEEEEKKEVNLVDFARKAEQALGSDWLQLLTTYFASRSRDPYSRNVCPFGHPHSGRTFSTSSYDEDVDGENHTADFVTIRMHSGPTLFTLPAHPDHGVGMTVGGLYGLVDRALDLPAGQTCSLYCGDTYIDRDQWWKDVTMKWGVDSGTIVLAVQEQIEECLVSVNVEPRQERLYVETRFSATRADVLATVAAILLVPVSDLFLAAPTFSRDKSLHPPFLDEHRLESNEILADDEDQEQRINYFVDPVIRFEVWIMSEAWARTRQEKERKDAGGSEASGPSIKEEDKSIGREVVQPSTSISQILEDVISSSDGDDVGARTGDEQVEVEPEKAEEETVVEVAAASAGGEAETPTVGVKMA